MLGHANLPKLYCSCLPFGPVKGTHVLVPTVSFISNKAFECHFSVSSLATGMPGSHQSVPASLQDRDAQHARDMQEASKRAAQDLEAKAMQLRSQLEQSQQALHVEKAQYGQQETLVQTQKQLDKLQLDLASERQKMKQSTGKSQEVAQAKQNALDASKALQVTLNLLVIYS